jgi:FtsZ-binding cell division protein ZapB
MATVKDGQLTEVKELEKVNVELSNSLGKLQIEKEELKKVNESLKKELVNIKESALKVGEKNLSDVLTCYGRYFAMYETQGKTCRMCRQAKPCRLADKKGK